LSSIFLDKASSDSIGTLITKSIVLLAGE